MLVFYQLICPAMEDQVPSSQVPGQTPSFPGTASATFPSITAAPGVITPAQLEELKQRARDMAYQQTLEQQQQLLAQRPTLPTQPPQVVYTRRSLTVAELILIFALSCGFVTTLQFIWGAVSANLPRIEIKVK